MIRLNTSVQPNMGSGVSWLSLSKTRVDKSVGIPQDLGWHRARSTAYWRRRGWRCVNVIPDLRTHYWYMPMTRILGLVTNVSARNVHLDRVTAPVHVYQTNNMKRCQFPYPVMMIFSLLFSGDAPSTLRFQGLQFDNWSGTAVTNKSEISIIYSFICVLMLYTHFSCRHRVQSSKRL